MLFNLDPRCRGNRDPHTRGVRSSALCAKDFIEVTQLSYCQCSADLYRAKSKSETLRDFATQFLISQLHPFTKKQLLMHCCCCRCRGSYQRHRCCCRCRGSYLVELQLRCCCRHVGLPLLALPRCCWPPLPF